MNKTILVVFTAATDGKDQLRYPAGEDTKALQSRRDEIGRESFRKEISGQFPG